MADTDTATGAEGGANADDGTAAASGGTAGTGTSNESSGARTFSQEELTAIVAREVNKVKDPELARKARAYDELQAQQQTDAERAETARQAAEDRAKQVIAEANNRLMTAELTLELSKQGARPEAVELAVARLLASGDVVVDDKGQVTGVEQAVKQLLAKNEYLKAPKQDAVPERSGGEHTGGGGGSNIDQQIVEAENKGDWSLARRLKFQKFG